MEAVKAYKDPITAKSYKPGDVWMILGSCEFIPPVEVRIKERRIRNPLDKNEGIYVRDMNTGEVKLISGQTYMLSAHEQLWSKPLSYHVDRLLSSGLDRMPFDKIHEVKSKRRDLTRAVTFKVKKGRAVQLFDYKQKKTRIVFGPEEVMLQPYETISTLVLSGGYPVKENHMISLALELGPSFINDQFVIETTDHATLFLELSFNWEF